MYMYVCERERKCKSKTNGDRKIRTETKDNQKEIAKFEGRDGCHISTELISFNGNGKKVSRKVDTDSKLIFLIITFQMIYN